MSVSPQTPRLTFGWGSKLRKADDFSSVFRFRRAVQGVFLEILVRPNKLDRFRLGLIVSKRYLPRAVDRNRLKRTLREGFRVHQAALDGYDFVVRLFARPPNSLQDHSSQVREECQNLLFKALALGARQTH